MAESNKTINNTRLTSKYDDWHTPHHIIDLSRKVLGTIDLDPASNKKANEYIKADHICDHENDGLKKAWFGNVFLNPPGGKTKNVSNSVLWWEKAELEFLKKNVDNLIWIAFSVEQLCINPTMLEYQVYFLRKRLKFIKDNKNRPTHSNAIILLSRDYEVKTRFNEKFNSIGKIINKC